MTVIRVVPILVCTSSSTTDQTALSSASLSIEMVAVLQSNIDLLSALFYKEDVAWTFGWQVYDNGMS